VLLWVCALLTIGWGLAVAQRSIQDALPGARVSIKTVDVTDDASVAATFAEILKEERMWRV